MKKLNNKNKYKQDLYEKSEGNHYFRQWKTTKQQKAHEALDKALQRKDFKKLSAVDDYDFY